MRPVHKLEPAVGGTYSMSFTNFSSGKSHSFSGKYIELVPNQRLRYMDQFDDPNLPGEIQVTVTLRPVSVGTELNIVQEGLPDMIPLEACYLGCRNRCEIWPGWSSPTSIPEQHNAPKPEELQRRPARIRIEEALRSLRGEPRNRGVRDVQPLSLGFR